jgi:purine nucleoside phosphorylase
MGLKLKEAAKSLNIDLKEGVYAAMKGPSGTRREH